MKVWIRWKPELYAWYSYPSPISDAHRIAAIGGVDSWPELVQTLERAGHMVVNKERLSDYARMVAA